MDAFLPGGPPAETTLDPEDLDEDYGESSSEDENVRAQLDLEFEPEREDMTPKERFLDPQVLPELSRAEFEPFRDLYAQIDLDEYDTERLKGRRHLVQFSLGAAKIRFEQVSHDEWGSPIWDCPSDGSAFKELPNLYARLDCNDENVFVQEAYAARPVSSPTVQWGSVSLSAAVGVKQSDKSDRILLELFGLICADPEAEIYRPYLPFGLKENLSKPKKVKSPSKAKPSKAGSEGKDPRLSAINRARTGKPKASA
jgi:hypothetical protein